MVKYCIILVYYCRPILVRMLQGSCWTASSTMCRAGLYRSILLHTAPYQSILLHSGLYWSICCRGSCWTASSTIYRTRAPAWTRGPGTWGQQPGASRGRERRSCCWPGVSSSPSSSSPSSLPSPWQPARPRPCAPIGCRMWLKLHPPPPGALLDQIKWFSAQKGGGKLGGGTPNV